MVETRFDLTLKNTHVSLCFWLPSHLSSLPTQRGWHSLKLRSSRLHGGGAGCLNVQASDSPFSLLLSSRCANLSFSVDKSFQARCVSFYFGVGSIFEQYGTVLGSHLQQM